MGDREGRREEGSREEDRGRDREDHCQEDRGDDRRADHEADREADHAAGHADPLQAGREDHHEGDRRDVHEEDHRSQACHGAQYANEYRAACPPSLDRRKLMRLGRAAQRIRTSDQYDAESEGKEEREDSRRISSTRQ